MHLSKRVFLKLFLITAAALPVSAQQPLSVVTTTTNLAWLAEKIGGTRVKVKALLKGTEDVHYIDAVPSFISDVANADVVCQVGLGLEVGWLPKVLSKSGNSKVQSGGAGHCQVGSEIEVIEKVQGPVDRSQGDVHPQGNPHFSLSPQRMKEAAKVLAGQLMALDPNHIKEYQSNLESAYKLLDEIHVSISQKLAPVRTDLRVLQYHKDFSYFFESYDIQSLGALEEKPGVPPSARRLAEMAIIVKEKNVNLLMGSLTSPVSVFSRFHDMASIPVVRLPTFIQPSDKKLNTYSKLQDHIAEAIISQVKSD